MKLYNKTLSELSRMLSEKKISSLELTCEFLGHIEKKDKDIGAYITVSEEEARLAALEADKRISRGENGVITGIPASVKDNICTAKMKTTCASKMLDGYVATYDASITENLKRAGAPILGKTNLDEFAMGSFGTGSALMETNNPINGQYVPGGSSSGSAAAVSAGLSVFSIGTDTGGSVRVPASFCGVPSFKPSYGAISRYGLIPYASSLDTVGIIAKTVSDISLIAPYVLSKDRRDMTSRDVRKGSGRESIRGIRFAFCEEDLSGATEEIEASVLKLCDILVRAGAERLDGDASLHNGIDEHYKVLVCAEAMSNLARYDGIKYGFGDFDDIHENRSVAFGKEVLRRIDFGNFVLREDNFKKLYEPAIAAREKASEKLCKLFDKCDILVLPLCDFNVPKKGETDFCNADRFTVLANFAGVPAISIPIGKDRNGMPVSAQIMSRALSDYDLIEVAVIIENLLEKEDVI